MNAKCIFFYFYKWPPPFTTNPVFFVFFVFYVNEIFMQYEQSCQEQEGHCPLVCVCAQKFQLVSLKSDFGLQCAWFAMNLTIVN